MRTTIQVGRGSRVLGSRVFNSRVFSSRVLRSLSAAVAVVGLISLAMAAPAAAADPAATGTGTSAVVSEAPQPADGAFIEITDAVSSSIAADAVSSSIAVDAVSSSIAADAVSSSIAPDVVPSNETASAPVAVPLIDASPLIDVLPASDQLVVFAPVAADDARHAAPAPVDDVTPTIEIIDAVSSSIEPTAAADPAPTSSPVPAIESESLSTEGVPATTATAVSTTRGVALLAPRRGAGAAPDIAVLAGASLATTGISTGATLLIVSVLLLGGSMVLLTAHRRVRTGAPGHR